MSRRKRTSRSTLAADRWLSVAGALALLAVVGIASGGWQFAHLLADHVHASAEVAAGGSTHDQTDRPGESDDDCAFCHLIASMKLTVAEPPTQVAGIEPIENPHKPAEPGLMLLTTGRSHGARAPPSLV